MPLGLSKLERIDILRGLERHILDGGDYPALLRFCRMYGTDFILPYVIHDITDIFGSDFNNIIDFGAGLCWLGEGIADHFRKNSQRDYTVINIDKRYWPGVNLVLDIEESAEEFSKLPIQSNDLVVMCDSLHCINCQYDLLKATSNASVVVIEFFPSNIDHMTSYNTQLKRYGAELFNLDAISKIKRTREVTLRTHGSHAYFYIKKEVPNV